MFIVSRVKVLWTGWSGAPGYSNFITGGTLLADLNAFATRVQAFLAAVAGQMPAPVQSAIQSTTEQFDANTGDLTGTLDITALPAQAGGAINNQFSSISGACVTWRTGVTVDGKRVRGRTFLVPLSTSAYENNGTLLDASLTSLRTAATNLASPGALPPERQLHVWHRPTALHVGIPVPTNAGTINDRVSFLKSRRG